MNKFLSFHHNSTIGSSKNIKYKKNDHNFHYSILINKAFKSKVFKFWLRDVNQDWIPLNVPKQFSVQFPIGCNILHLVLLFQDIFLYPNLQVFSSLLCSCKSDLLFKNTQKAMFKFIGG